MIDNNPLTELINRPASPDFWRWGTVKSLNPQTILLDGDNAPLQGAYDSLTELHVGDRVLTHCANQHLTIIGVRSSVSSQDEKPRESVGLAAYPVGAFFWSANPTSPEELFGGRWRQITDAFLYAASPTHMAGSRGGEENHMLTVDEMPSHAHGPGEGSYVVNFAGGGSGNGAWGSWGSYDNTVRTTYTTGAAGGNQPHNNMPPFLAAYCWQRIG